MRLSIIIPTKDRGEIFSRTLDSVVEAVRSINAEIIVVNDSKTGEPVIPPDYHQVRMVNNPKRGVASARNLGADLAISDTLIFMDDDIVVDAAVVVKAMERVTKDPGKIHLFNWVYPPDLQSALTHTQFGRYLSAFGLTSLKGWLGPEWRDEEVFELKDGASYFLPMDKKVFREIGGYEENFPHAGAEDYEFVQRTIQKGSRFYLDTSLTVYHNEADRLDVVNWLERKRRTGETLKMAATLGYSEVGLQYPVYKRIGMRLMTIVKSPLLIVLKIIPNFSWLDSIYFVVTNVLLSIYLFEGYTRGEQR